jgi:phosphate transport system substrate-binding protein
MAGIFLMTGSLSSMTDSRQQRTLCVARVPSRVAARAWWPPARGTVRWFGGVGVATALVFSCPMDASADVVRVGGSVGAEAIMRQLGGAFTAQSGIAIKVVPGLGSTGGLRAATDGVVDLVVGGRLPGATDAGKELKIAFSARTPFVLATSHPNPGDIRRDQLAEIIGSPSAKWPDGVPVRVILRARSATETVLMGTIFPGAAVAIEIARRRPEITTAGQ